MRLLPPEVSHLVFEERRRIFLFAVVACCVAVLEAIELLNLLLLGNLLLGEDIAQVKGGTFVLKLVAQYSQRELIVILGAALAGIVLLRSGLSLQYKYSAYGWAGRSTARLSNHVFAALLAAPISLFDRRRLGEMLNSLIESPTSAVIAVEGVTGLLLRGTSLAIVAAALFYISPWLLVASVVIVVPLLLAIAHPSHRRMRGFQRKLVEERATATDIGASVITGIREIRAVSTEPRMASLFASEVERWGKSYARVWFMKFVPKPALQGVIQLAFACAVVLMGTLLSPEDFGTHLATLGVFGYSLFRFYPALDQMSSYWMDIHRAVPGLRDAASYVEGPRDTLAGGATPVRSAFETIAFDHVSFSYGETTQALMDVTFSVERGKITAIVGESGSGKSTLIDLLLKFRSPSQGAICVGTQNLSDLIRQSWLSRVGVVRQDVFLFSGTIRANLLASRPHASDEALLEACRQAGALAFIQSLPDGLDTIVGDRGVTLSGGQRQRIAIARALLREPDLLILDEALSALDGETEMQILESILERASQRTVLLVSHRLTTVGQADHVIVLDCGRIVEQGSPAYLLEKGGRYADLFCSQLSDSHATVR